MWPLAGLELRCADLVLRPTVDSDCVALGRIVHGLLDPAEAHFMPGLMANARAETATVTARNLLRWNWERCAELSAQRWVIPLTVLVDGEVVGSQALHTVDFAVLGDVHTGSYLAREHRGRGVGTAMRAIVLEFAFAHLGASTASSAYATGNVASARISQRVGYLDDGLVLDSFDGVRFEYRRQRLDAQRWCDHRPGWLDGLEVRGLAPVLGLLGLDGAAPVR